MPELPSPLLHAMVEKYHYPVLDDTELDGFLSAHHEVVLFFAGNPSQFPETDDVALILPELVKAFATRLQAALIATGSERALQSRFGFATWPALVFLRDGQPLGTITRVRNWDDYLREIQHFLDAGPAPRPAITIPIVATGARP